MLFPNKGKINLETWLCVMVGSCLKITLSSHFNHPEIFIKKLFHVVYFSLAYSSSLPLLYLNNTFIQ